MDKLLTTTADVEKRRVPTGEAHSTMAPPVQLLRTADAARYLGVSPSTLNKMRCYGNGPVFCRFGRAVRYRTDDLDAWMMARRATDTTDADHRLPRRLVDTGLRGTAEVEAA